MQLTRFGKAKTSTFIKVKRAGTGKEEFYKVKQDSTEQIDEKTYAEARRKGRR